eukprot:1053887-Prorocentrum_minimum.AAC.1
MMMTLPHTKYCMYVQLRSLATYCYYAIYISTEPPAVTARARFSYTGRVIIGVKSRSTRLAREASARSSWAPLCFYLLLDTIHQPILHARSLSSYMDLRVKTREVGSLIAQPSSHSERRGVRVRGSHWSVFARRPFSSTTAPIARARQPRLRPSL